MTTPRLTNTEKMRRAFGRAFATLPAGIRDNWRNVLMPWRMIPCPVALALIGLVALAMVLDEPEPVATTAASTVVISTIGGTEIPDGLNCEEDEAIAFNGTPDTLECVHVDTLAER